MTKFKSVFQIICLIVISYYLLGCASQMAQSPTGEPITDIISSLKKGDLRLTCDTACSGKWGGIKTRIKGLYENKLWTDLAIEISNVGFRVDQNYYYLGSSAEGLGYPDAAYIYYKLSLATAHKCNGLINNCESLDIPSLTNTALTRIEKLTAVSKATNVPTTETKKEQILIKQSDGNAQSINCKTDSDCESNKFCASTVNGKYECQIKSNIVPTSVKTNETMPEPKASVLAIPANNDISKLESTCVRIGFKKGTEQFGDCVLELKVRATKTK